MELAKIEALLEAYFEGNTSLAEEALLRDYFKNNEVAAGLKQYQPLFAGLEMARKEVSLRDIEIPEKARNIQSSRWYGIAASVAVILVVGGIMFSNPSITQEEKEALAALNESKEALLFLSENLNKGTEQLAFVSQFTETKNRILK
jgi:hypothetical protein